MSQGSRRSTARLVVQTDGHLKSGSMALRSNDCWRMDESPGEPVAICCPPVLNGPHRLGFAPGFDITFPTHTNGTRPVKTPVPPRTCVERSPEAFQLNPTRGENMGLAPGSDAWSIVSEFP